jgi:glycerol-3-phosphate acyltransferase PlsY
VGLLDQRLAVQAAAGVAAIVGHNWSPYIGFTGGRGVATGIGVILGFVLWKETLMGLALIGILGRVLSRETALLTAISLLALPPAAYLFGQPPEIVVMFVAMALVILLKRLTGNWEKPRGEYSLLRVLAFRLLWDRDVPRGAEWTARRPPAGQRE